MPDEIPSTAVPNRLTHVSTDEESPARSEVSWKDRVLRLGDASTESWWRGVPTSLVIAGFITILGLWIEPVIRGPNLAIFYMLAVVFSAVRWGRWAVIINAISSAFLFDYFFVLPYRSFVIGDVWYLITLIGLLTVGLIVSVLVVATKEEARASRRSEAHLSALYALTSSLAAESKMDQIIDSFERHVVETFRRPIVVLLPEAGGLTVRFRSAQLAFDEREGAAAAYVFGNDQEAGNGTNEFSDSTMRYLPLKSWRGVVGVAGIQVEGWNEWHSSLQQLLRSFMSQAALAITRADLVRKAQQAETLQETDKLQKALLNSVSHNLRTPLASVLGVLNTILEDGSLLDVPTQQRLLKTARNEAKTLDWLVQNLLDMTRLEGGAIRVKAEPCDVHDVVASALRQLGESARSHAIVVSIAPGLPFVPMDDVLMVQVLVNLLDNALKYSPADATVEIQARLAVGQLKIGVLDHGMGIPEGELERVFDKFYRVAVPGAPKGTGLGLSICKGFVEAHNGRILAKRRTEGGTEIAVFLPLESRRE
jgi:two-component system, OmpR family, sensor histidine kinase KdpD